MAKSRLGDDASVEDSHGIWTGMIQKSLFGKGPDPDESTKGTTGITRAKRKTRTLGDADMNTRDSLLRRITDPDNNESWTEFFDIYSPFIRKIGMRRGLDAQRAEDLVIIVLHDMNAKILKFDKEKGGFRKWLKTIACRKAIDLWRKDKRFPLPILNKPNNVSETNDKHTEDRVAEPENALEAFWDAEEAKAILKLANGITKQRVSLRKWQLFECRILRKWAVERVSQTFAVTPNTVFIAVHNVRPVYEAAIIEAKKHLDRGPLSPLDKKALNETLPLPSFYAKSKRVVKP